MTEYQIDANTRRCAASGRELQVGERFYSVLLEQTGKFERRDYSAEAWQGPPEGTFSFWSGKIPASNSGRLPKIDEETLFDCFERLENDTGVDRVRFRFIVALLLMRKKRLKLEKTITEGSVDCLAVRCRKTGKLYRLTDPRMTEDEMASVQEEVLGVLGWQ
jgi:hypothetical protein